MIRKWTAIRRYLPARVALFAAALLALAVAPAAAGHLVTFTGTFDYSDSFSTRWDGTNQFEDDLPPLFDLSRLEGGSFRATFQVPDVPPVDEDSGFATFEYDPPTPLTLTLLDAAGDVVHLLGGGLYGLDVENFSTPGRPGRPPLRSNNVSFYAATDGLSGLIAPPELYGPNRFAFADIAAYFVDGTRPLGDVSIPLDGSTYLDFDEREFEVSLAVTNGDPGGDGPNLYVSTQLVYRITGASVVTAAVPEPASLTLLGTGALVLIGHVWRRKPKASADRAWPVPGFPDR